MRRGAAGQTDQGSCLFERSEFARYPGWTEHRRLPGRYDDTVYRIDTQSGAVDKIKVGREPHGLTVWPQPGRYSLGHTGNLR
jgi:hypothetical protein